MLLILLLFSMLPSHGPLGWICYGNLVAKEITTIFKHLLFFIIIGMIALVELPRWNIAVELERNRWLLLLMGAVVVSADYLVWRLRTILTLIHLRSYNSFSLLLWLMFLKAWGHYSCCCCLSMIFTILFQSLSSRSLLAWATPARVLELSNHCCMVNNIAQLIDRICHEGYLRVSKILSISLAVLGAIKLIWWLESSVENGLLALVFNFFVLQDVFDNSILFRLGWHMSGCDIDSRTEDFLVYIEIFLPHFECGSRCALSESNHVIERFHRTIQKLFSTFLYIGFICRLSLPCEIVSFLSLISFKVFFAKDLAFTFAHIKAFVDFFPSFAIVNL